MRRILPHWRSISCVIARELGRLTTYTIKRKAQYTRNKQLPTFVISTVFSLFIASPFSQISTRIQQFNEMATPKHANIILTIAEAIAHKEGFYAPTSTRAKRNNNPGNLRNWDSKLPKDDSGFDIFDSRSEGFRALYRQIELNVVRKNLSMYEFFAGKTNVYAGYAPASDNNDPRYYAEFVLSFLSERGYTPLSLHTAIWAWYTNESFSPSKDLKEQVREQIISKIKEMDLAD